MIKTQRKRGSDEVKVTFVLPEAEAPEGTVAVVGDFNDWDPGEHPLKKRANQTRSVVIELPADAEFEFRYLAEGGGWLHDPEADRRGENNILRT